MLLQAREAQRKLSSLMLDLRDCEYRFDQTLGDFLLLLKQTLGARREDAQILSVDELRQLTEKAQQQRRHVKPLTDYLASLARTEKVFDECILRHMYFSLSLIHERCETETQTAQRRRINKICSHTLALLRSEKTLEKVAHQEWLPKILQREQKTFLGIVSLLPQSISNALEIDTLLDDYMNPFGVRYGSK